MTSKFLGRLGLAAALVAALAVPSAASASAVTPQFVAGNPSCADYGLKGLKVDRSDVAGDYTDGTLSVHIEQATGGGKITSWTSNIGVDKVILKGGAGSDGTVGSNVYSYNPEATGDTDLVVPNGTALSHIEFCYDTGDTPPPNQCGTSDMDNDGVNDSCDNCPSVANPGQEDTNGNGMGDACETTPQQTCQEQHAGEADTDGDGIVDACDSTPNGSTSNNTTTETPQQTVAGEQQGSAPAAEQPAQAVLGERISAGTARLIAATGCQSRTFRAGVRGSQIKRVVFKLDGKRIATVTKRNAKGLYALRINPAKYRIGVHRLVVTVTFNSASRTSPRTLRASFQRCARALVSPRFTG